MCEGHGDGWCHGPLKWDAAQRARPCQKGMKADEGVRAPGERAGDLRSSPRYLPVGFLIGWAWNGMAQTKSVCMFTRALPMLRPLPG